MSRGGSSWARRNNVAGTSAAAFGASFSNPTPSIISGAFVRGDDLLVGKPRSNADVIERAEHLLATATEPNRPDGQALLVARLLTRIAELESGKATS